jgi:uncharacterized protein YmfQ (DUF2313 family)
MVKKKLPFLSHGRSVHHVLAKSRGGGDEACNLVTLKDRLHSSWHTLFANDTPEEVVAKMLYTWESTCPLNKQDPAGDKLIDHRIAKRRKAWRAVFGSADQDEAIQIVLDTFSQGREHLIKGILRSYQKGFTRNGDKK